MNHTEIDAFLSVLPLVEPDAPTRCAGWTAHDLLAHVAAGGEEIHRLAADTIAGRPPTPTRPFAEREAPLRALAASELRDRLTVTGIDLLTSLEMLRAEDPAGTVSFTGAELTADQLLTHVRSELAIHRWDLVGDDAVSRELLAQPDLLAHGRMVLAQMPTLTESADRPADDRDDLLRLWGRRGQGRV